MSTSTTTTRLVRGICGAAAVLLSITVAAAPAFAQSGVSVMQGTVTDPTKKTPVAEAIVTVTSPALQVEQIVVTDSAGFYRVPTLPPGVYLLRVDKPSFLPYERPGVALRADITLQVNVDLVPESAKAEEITIIQRAPTIDLGSSSVTTTISPEMARRVPIAAPSSKGGGVRSFESLAEAAPAAKADLYGTSVAGTTSPENRYMIDGLAVNNTAFGIGGTPLSSEFIQQIDVVTGGYLPEYGRSTGGVLSVTTKSGSNQIRGSAWTYATPGFLEGAAKDSPFQEGQAVHTDRPRATLVADVGTDIGLPIILNKLWLYAGVQYTTTQYELGRSFWQNRVEGGMPVLDANNLTVRDQIPGTQKNWNAVGNTLQAIGKLSFSPSADHQLSFTTVAAPFRSGGSNQFGIDPSLGVPEIDPSRNIILNGTQEALASKFKNDAFDNLLKWTASAKGKRIVVDTTFGWHHEISDTLPSDGSLPGSGQGLAAVNGVRYRRTSPHSLRDFETVPEPYCDPAGTASAVLCPVSSYNINAPFGRIEHDLLDRYQLRSVVSMLGQAWGHHVVKLGVDLEATTFDVLKAFAGGNVFRENGAGSVFADYRNYGYLVGPDQPVLLDSLHSTTKTYSLGGFVQDSWSVLDKVTVNAGLRYDTQAIYNSQSQLGLTLPNQFSPRAGVIWDPTQRGGAKLFASYARYYQSVPLDMADRSLSGEPQIQSVHDAKTCNPARADQAKGACLSNLTTQNDPFDPNAKWGIIGGSATPVDPDIKPSSSNEVVLGGEMQLLGESRAGLSYTRRWLNDIIEDMSRDEATTYFLGNPGRGIASGFPRPERNYDAVSLYFSRAFFERWLAQASYTLSWLYGNYSGLFRPENGQLDPNITSDFDLQSILANRTGDLPGDRRHQLKLFAARDFNLKPNHHLLLGLGARATSGGPTNYFGSHAVYGTDEVFILPRGSGPRLPWQFTTDVQLGYTFAMGNGRELTVSVDVYNLLNLQRATAVDNTYTRTDVLPSTSGITGTKTTDGAALDKKDVNPNFGHVIAYQDPRMFRFGLRFNY
jgi:outer membrane receptor protein involved in Fe transport